MKIHKGDTVVIRTGKDRGKSGTVVRTFPKKDMVLIDGINTVKRHKKATRRGSQGQIVEKPMPIPVANVGVKGKSGKAVRVGYKVEGTGKEAKKVRIARQGGAKI